MCLVLDICRSGADDSEARGPYEAVCEDVHVYDLLQRLDECLAHISINAICRSRRSHLLELGNLALELRDLLPAVQRSLRVVPVARSAILDVDGPVLTHK